jgi:hypothetical protein
MLIANVAERLDVLIQNIAEDRREGIEQYLILDDVVNVLTDLVRTIRADES